MPESNIDKEAYALALRRLGSRDYSSSELCAYLENKGVAPEKAAAVVAELVKSRFLDDSRYAAAVARAQGRRGKGPAYIRQKLKQKGVSMSSDDIKRVVAESEGKTELERAREIVERRYPLCKKDKAVAVKAMQALVRRGFSFDVARQATGGRASIDLSDDRGLSGDDT